MPKNLVIVESPTKAKTISKFLGKDFQVESSFGHVRDLPKSKIGVDTEKNFEPKYVVPTRAKKRVSELKKLAEDADMIYFATDEDREGEAISWHLASIFKTPKDKIKRIVFHEITEEAITESFKNPRSIDNNLVDAQQARRILDRLVGYQLSPLLWKKVARGLSAGRVQSVAVRLVVDREDEINAFNPEEFWTIDALFSDKKPDAIQFEAKLAKIDGKSVGKFGIKDEKQAKEITKNLDGKKYSISEIEKKQTKKSPLPPFTTSTLQQAANNKLGFSAKQAMVLAQQLYEGINIGSEGSVGLITYMRTDSFSLSQKFLQETQGYIKSKFGDKFTTGTRGYKSKSKLSQEAHEAIRPTSVNHDPLSIKQYLDDRQFKLYQLIWQRAVASQMSEALIDTIKVDIQAQDTPYTFRANGSTINFKGFLEVYPTDTKENILPELQKSDAVNLDKLDSLQHFTQPPARYSEATLVKIMEEHGIGRPSTYAPTIATIQDRGYIEKIEKKLHPTDAALLVNKLLVEHFPDIVDYSFTAELENDFDKIAEGARQWQDMLEAFYTPFEKRLKEKEETITKEEVMSIREIGIDPKTNKPVFVRMGRFGPFVQLGSKDDEEKPKFASLKEGQLMDKIELEDALHLLSLPRLLGKDADGTEILANIGRFGPYVKLGSRFISTPEQDPYEITLEKALEFIAGHNKKEAEKNIKEFDGSEVKVLNGRYGPYITDGTLNAKIPKDIEPKSLTLEKCTEILQTTGKKKGARRSFTKKKK